MPMGSVLLHAALGAVFALTVSVVSAAEQDTVEESTVVAGKSWPLGRPANGRDLIISNRCERCHGLEGRAEQDDRPNLAGQSQNYLVKQLLDFKAGAAASIWPGRIQRLMSPHAKELDDQQVADVAAYYSSRECLGSLRKPIVAPPRPKIAARCEACHGPGGAAPQSPSLPRLAGQNLAYLVNQIGQFKDHAHGLPVSASGQFRGHPLMDHEAKPLSDKEIRGLAAYFSASRCR